MAVSDPRDTQASAEKREEFLAKVERMRRSVKENGKPYTNSEIAKELGVSTKTIQRATRDLQNQGRYLKKEIPHSQYMRDEIFEQHVDTFQAIKRAIIRTERIQQMLDAELGFEQEVCECCGRPPIKPDFLKWQTAGKLGDTVNNQITTLAKLLGQISDNQLILIQQIDDDVMLILTELAKLDQNATRQLFNALVAQSERRRQRLPELDNIVEGEYRQLDAPDGASTEGPSQ
jgi:transposase